VTDRGQRHVLIGVTGGIASCKMPMVVSALVKRGDRVTVAMTESAARFVGPATFEALSGRPVYRDPWTAIDDPASQHVSLARSIDIALIAPCSMHSIARFASGLADDAVSLLVGAIDRASTPVLVAPSMNATMLAQPATKRNLSQLSDDGFTVLEPASGWQACRTDGCGRLPEPDELVAAIDAAC